MFKKFVAQLKLLVQKPVPVEPKIFGDALAERVSWEPVKGGGASFRTRASVRVSPNRLEFKATVWAKAFYLLFVLAGFGFAVGILIAEIRDGQRVLRAELLLPLFIGGVFAVAGIILFYFGTAPVVFDRSRNAYWRGRKTPNSVHTRSKLKDFVRLDRVCALQILSEYVRGNKASYYSYELNLILDDAERINVVDHGNLVKLRKDAQELAQFLNVPLWDATRERSGGY